MPRVYRHQWSDGRKSVKWYIEYRDASGRLRRRPAYRDKSLSINLLAETIKREERIAAGLEVETVAQPLADLVNRWQAYALGKGVTEKHASESVALLKKVFKACKFFDVKSLSGARAQDYLEGLIKAGRANKTYQGYRSCLLAFGNWLVKKEKLLPSNPFTTIDSRDVEQNRKLIRRVLTEPEFKRLLKAAKAGPRRLGLTGEQRYYLYLVAAYTGLRLGALRRVAPANFDLKAGTISVDSSMQKNRKSHCVPLPADLVARLRKWLAGKDSTIPLWRSMGRGTRFIRFDLATAGIPYKTAEGQADFHALRHLFAVRLVRAGASVVEAQHLLDHCSPVLTSRYYRHLKTDELRGPIGKLPKL